MDSDYYFKEFERLYAIRDDGDRHGIIVEAIKERDVLAARVQELEAALREIAAGPRDQVVTAPDAQPSIVVGGDQEGYAVCLAIARAALDCKHA